MAYHSQGEFYAGVPEHLVRRTVPRVSEWIVDLSAHHGAERRCLVTRIIDDLDAIAAVVTQRSESIFATAMRDRRDALREGFSGKCVMMTGGAGFIATQTLKQILPFGPQTVVVVDSDENRMAELIRTLRSAGLVPSGTRIEPRLVDITTPLVGRLMDEWDGVDICLQFAAAKHVRTERDPVSLLRMLQVNLLGTMDLTAALLEHFDRSSLFVVSTDKAADPSSFMGASKRLMEMAVLGTYPQSTTTRFANVAFSNGSLLESWILRLRQGQPLAVPADTWRYFVTPQEAGQLCALAATAPPGSVVVPDESVTGLVELSEALERVLATEGRRARFFTDESALEPAATGAATYPVVVSPRDTAGEKHSEKFVGDREDRQPWAPNLGLVHTAHHAAAALEFSEWLRSVIDDPKMPTDLADLARRMSSALPEFAHIASVKRLDDRI